MPKLKTAAEVKDLIHNGTLLIDIREPKEFASGHIPGARNIPLSRLKETPQLSEDVIFTCQSGRRTGGNNRAFLRGFTKGRAYVLNGGMNAWQENAFPIEFPEEVEGVSKPRKVLASGLIALAASLVFLARGRKYALLPLVISAGLIVFGLKNGESEDLFSTCCKNRK